MIIRIFTHIALITNQFIYKHTCLLNSHKTDELHCYHLNNKQKNVVQSQIGTSPHLTKFTPIIT